MPPTDRTAAARKRRWRERQARGERVLPIPITDADIERLIAGGVLRPSDADIADRIIAAIRVLLETGERVTSSVAKLR